MFFICVFPSLAFADSDPDQINPDDSSDSGVTYNIIESPDYSEQLDDIRSSVSDLNDTMSAYELRGDLIGETKEVLRVSASDTNGLKSILLSILGDYDTVTTDYTYQSSNGYTSHSITTERDWAWICSAAIFGSVVWCVFRGVVAILCRN